MSVFPTAVLKGPSLVIFRHDATLSHIVIMNTMLYLVSWGFDRSSHKAVYTKKSGGSRATWQHKYRPEAFRFWVSISKSQVRDIHLKTSYDVEKYIWSFSIPLFAADDRSCEEKFACNMLCQLDNYQAKPMNFCNMISQCLCKTGICSIISPSLVF